MDQKKTASPSLIKLGLILFAVAAVTSLILGLVNFVTKDRIAELAAEKTATAYANVLVASTYEETDAYTDESGTVTKLSYAKDEAGNVIGYVVEATFSGAQGMVTQVTGIDVNMACTGIYITSSSETAGLGALASETQEGAWRDNLVGATVDVALAKDGGTVEAISGATITSRACTNAVKTAITAVMSIQG